MLRKVAEQYWLPEMYVNIKVLEKTCKQWDKIVPLWHDRPLNRLTVSWLWQRVGWIF
jgi:hypothetical protein